MDQSLIALKSTLHQYCLDLIQQRMATARSAMDEAAEAAAQETKSSVGDKYETGRAMMQNEKEKNKVQLLKAMQLKNEMNAIRADKICKEVELGSLVVTNHGIFYFAIGLGKVKLEEQIYFMVSLNAPLGQAMRGKKAKEEVVFQNRQYIIEAII